MSEESISSLVRQAAYAHADEVVACAEMNRITPPGAFAFNSHRWQDAREACREASAQAILSKWRLLQADSGYK